MLRTRFSRSRCCCSCAAAAASVLACGFVTVETILLRRYYVPFFIELGSRSTSRAAQPTQPAPGVTRQARNLGFTRLFERTRFLIHDRDSKFSAAFDEVFRGEDIKVIHTPVRASRTNACAERFVCPVRAQCLDWLLIPGRRRPPRTCAPPVASTATPSGRTEHSPSSHLQIATSASSPPRTRSSGMTSSAD